MQVKTYIYNTHRYEFKDTNLDFKEFLRDVLAVKWKVLILVSVVSM